MDLRKAHLNSELFEKYEKLLKKLSDEREEKKTLQKQLEDIQDNPKESHRNVDYSGRDNKELDFLENIVFQIDTLIASVLDSEQVEEDIDFDHEGWIEDSQGLKTQYK